MSFKEIKAHNPEMRTFGGGILGLLYAAYGQKIKIPVELTQSVHTRTDSGAILLPFFTNLDIDVNKFILPKLIIHLRLMSIKKLNIY